MRWLNDLLSAVESQKWKTILSLQSSGKAVKGRGTSSAEAYRIKEVSYSFSLRVGKWGLFYDSKMYYLMRYNVWYISRDEDDWL